MSGSATLHRKSTKLGRQSHLPAAATGDDRPVEIYCPSCDAPLGFALRVTLETARQAAKRPQLPEALVACPNCHRAWVAGLWLSIAAFAGSEVAA